MRFNCLGLDLSLTNTGIAVVQSDTEKVLHLRSVKTGTSDGSRIVRADFIADQVEQVLEQFRPDLIIIEEYAFSRPTMVSALGELGGIVKLRLWQATGVDDCWITTPSSACKKVICGTTKRGSGKQPMIDAAQPFMRQYRHDHNAAFTDFKNDNLADAIGLARYGIIRFTQLVLDSMR